MAEKVIKALHLLIAADSTKEIRIIMNSSGGNWTDGMAIYNAIKACPVHVTIEVYGSCMSMATVILQAADERVLHPDTTFMVHDGHEEISGSPKTVEAWAKRSKYVRKRMYEIYAERSKKSVSFWEKRCTSDLILSSQEAVDMGLADKVAGEEHDE
jgi:ATP-dependent Clp protease protease subunit